MADLGGRFAGVRCTDPGIHCNLHSQNGLGYIHVFFASQLTAMDYQRDLAQNGTPLWEHLIWLQRKSNLEPLDPIPLRNIIMAKEKDRILKDNIAPINRLFDLGQHEIFHDENLLIDPNTQRMGQQDCKDFFICLAENREHWVDVYNLFKVNVTSFTT